MSVQKMDPHRPPCLRSSRVSLIRAALQASLGREGHVVHTRFFSHGRGFPTPYILCPSAMLCLHVTCYQSICHLLPSLPVLHPSLLTLPVGRSLSHHPSPVRRLQLGSCRLACVADHADCLPYISPQDQPTKQANQGTKDICIRYLKKKNIDCGNHGCELPVNYRVFTVVMVIYTSVRRIMHYYLTPDFSNYFLYISIKVHNLYRITIG